MRLPSILLSCIYLLLENCMSDATLCTSGPRTLSHSNASYCSISMQCRYLAYSLLPRILPCIQETYSPISQVTMANSKVSSTSVMVD